MVEKIEEVILKDGNYPAFVIHYEKYSENKATFSFVLHEVISWVKDEEINETRLYMSGQFKWDGDCHLQVGEEGYLYLGGKGCFKLHIQVMEALYKFIQDKIKGFDPGEYWK